MKQAKPLTALIALYLGVACLYGLIQLLRGTPVTLSWAGLALATFPAMVCIILEFRNPPRSLRPPLGYTLASGLGLVITMVISWRYGAVAGWVHAWAGLGFISWVGYVRWLRHP